MPKAVDSRFAYFSNPALCGLGTDSHQCSAGSPYFGFFQQTTLPSLVAM